MSSSSLPSMTGILSKRATLTGLTFSGVSSALSLDAAADFDAAASGDAEGRADAFVASEDAGALEVSDAGVAVGVGVGVAVAATLPEPPSRFCAAKRISSRLKE